MIKKNPYEKNIQKKCQVCSQQVAIDQFGNGDPCPVCGWVQDNMSWEFPDRVINPTLLSLNKAKKMFSEGKPLIPSFDDFIDGLFFYSEMKFTYKNVVYGVGFFKNQISIYNSEIGHSSLYKDRGDFSANANINGTKLRDIWHEVTDAGFML